MLFLYNKLKVNMASDTVALSFKVGASSAFPLTEQRFLDSVITYGVAGKELIENKRADPLHVPKSDDVDEQGGRRYALASYRSKDGDLVEENFLSDSGDRRFFEDQKEHRADIKQNEKHAITLMAYMLSICPPSSIQVLVALGSKYTDAKLKVDTFAIWEMIRSTHLHSSGWTKLRHLAELLGTKQTTTREAYMGDITQRGRLFLAGFGSAKHAGYIEYDVLLKALYLNGLDQQAFQRPLDELCDKKSTTCAEAMEICQEYYLDRCTDEPASFAGKALLAGEQTPQASQNTLPFRDRPNLGQYDPKTHSQYCAHCWKNRFKKEHQQNTCNFFLTSVKKARSLAAKQNVLALKRWLLPLFLVLALLVLQFRVLALPVVVWLII